jgi:hypothetical protein
VVRAQTAPQTARIVRSSYINPTVVHRERGRGRDRSREDSALPRRWKSWDVDGDDERWLCVVHKDSQPRPASSTGTYACIKQLPNVRVILPYKPVVGCSLAPTRWLPLPLPLTQNPSHHITSLPFPSDPITPHRTCDLEDPSPQTGQDRYIGTLIGGPETFKEHPEIARSGAFLVGWLTLWARFAFEASQRQSSEAPINQTSSPLRHRTAPHRTAPYRWLPTQTNQTNQTNLESPSSAPSTNQHAPIW